MPSSTKIFLGNIDYHLTVAELTQALAESLGLRPLEVRIIFDKASGLGKGFAFLSFATPEIAAHAISLLNGHSLFGRTLRSDLATERTGRPDTKPRHSSSSFSSSPPPSSRSFLPPSSRVPPRTPPRQPRVQFAAPDYDKVWRDLPHEGVYLSSGSSRRQRRRQ